MIERHYFRDQLLKSFDFEPQIKALLESEKPDVVLLDSDIVAPCLIKGNIPWVYLFCCNPIGFFDSQDLPPFTSGNFLKANY